MWWHLETDRVTGNVGCIVRDFDILNSERCIRIDIEGSCDRGVVPRSAMRNRYSGPAKTDGRKRRCAEPGSGNSHWKSTIPNLSPVRRMLLIVGFHRAAAAAPYVLVCQGTAPGPNQTCVWRVDGHIRIVSVAVRLPGLTPVTRPCDTVACWYACCSRLRQLCNRTVRRCPTDRD